MSRSRESLVWRGVRSQWSADATSPGGGTSHPAAARLPDWPARAPAGNAPYDLICTPQLRSAEAPAVVPNQADTCADARRLRLLSVTSFPQPPSSSSGRVQGCRLATRQGSGPAAPTVFDPVCGRTVGAFSTVPPKAGSPVIVDSYLRISAVIVHDNPLASVKWRLMQLRTLIWRHRQDRSATTGLANAVTKAARPSSPGAVAAPESAGMGAPGERDLL
jgi:hypothetical protein